MAKSNNGLKKLSMKKLQVVLSKFQKPMQLLDQIIYNMNKSVIPVQHYTLLAANEKPAKLSLLDEESPLAAVNSSTQVYEAIPVFNNNNQDYYLVQTLEKDGFTITQSHKVSYNLKTVQEINPYSFTKAALVTKEDPTKPAFMTVSHNDDIILTVFM